MNWFLLKVLLCYVILVCIVAGLSLVAAIFNFSLGIRSNYVQLLLTLFQWGQKRCEKKILQEDNEEDPSLPDASPSKLSSKANPIPGGKFVSTRNLVHEKDGYSSLQEKIKLTDKAILQKRKKSELSIDRHADDLMDMCRWGMEVIVSDIFTESINTAELDTWNLMTRQDRGYRFISVRLTFFYSLSVFVRYVVFLPIRFLIFLGGLVFITIASLFLALPLFTENTRRWADVYMNQFFFRILARSMSLSATYHNPENRARPGGVCVANHTSPIDMITLGYDNYYSLVGQKHTGLLGLMEKALARVSPHIWFDRFEKKDRNATMQKMISHTSAKKAPIMIFPEGVCVNNTTVLKFRKGCFEIGCPVYPAAIKYDRRFSDPYWVEDTIGEHLVHIFSSWAVKADIYYLEPMERGENESGMEFAIRVKEAVALKGEFMGVDWDGTLKYLPVRPEVMLELRKDYSRRVAHTQRTSESE